MNKLSKIFIGLLGLGAGLAYVFRDKKGAVDNKVRNKILRTIATIESGMNYGTVYVVPGQELSYGLLQTRMKYGGLGRLLNRYLEQGDARYSEELRPYMARVEAEDRTLEDESGFKNLLKLAGADPAMQRAQDAYFDQEYLKKAYDWAESKGFTLPVSWLAIADTFVHSGSHAPFRWAGITSFPVDGEDEKDVLRRYLKWRESWLTMKGGVLARTAFRPRLYLQLLDSDPNLEGDIAVKGTLIS